MSVHRHQRYHSTMYAHVQKPQVEHFTVGKSQLWNELLEDSDNIVLGSSTCDCRVLFKFLLHVFTSILQWVNSQQKTWILMSPRNCGDSWESMAFGLWCSMIKCKFDIGECTFVSKLMNHCSTDQDNRQEHLLHNIWWMTTHCSILHEYSLQINAQFLTAEDLRRSHLFPCHVMIEGNHIFHWDTTWNKHIWSPLLINICFHELLTKPHISDGRWPTLTPLLTRHSW